MGTFLTVENKTINPSEVDRSLSSVYQYLIQRSRRLAALQVDSCSNMPVLISNGTAENGRLANG